MNRFALWLSLFLGSITAAEANVTLPAVFGNHMVMQQNSKVTVWGWAKPFEEVTVTPSWGFPAVKTTTPSEGVWSVVLDTPAAGGPYTLRINGWNEILIHDILMGEVWLCSGQSNMEWTPNSVIQDGAQHVSEANCSEIRFFTVYPRAAQFPTHDVTGQWVVCTPETMNHFSAVGYFFGRELHRELKVPVGLIHSSWGGSNIEAWSPEASILQNTSLAKAAGRIAEVPWSPTKPGRLFNAMIAPLVPYKLAGVIWYQGEANVANAYAYPALMENMIQNWRLAFHTDFPLVYAQIAPWSYDGRTQGVELREAQRRALSIPKTAMVVLSDIGDTVDIHPRNKLDAGIRFARMSLHAAYGQSAEKAYGPMFQSVLYRGHKAIVSFKYASGLTATVKNPEHFQIAGPDGIFVPARAVIRGETVELTAQGVKQPAFVRFEWRNNVVPQLFNGVGLPASCFTTEKEFAR